MLDCFCLLLFSLASSSNKQWKATKLKEREIDILVYRVWEVVVYYEILYLRRAKVFVDTLVGEHSIQVLPRLSVLVAQQEASIAISLSFFVLFAHRAPWIFEPHFLVCCLSVFESVCLHFLIIFVYMNIKQMKLMELKVSKIIIKNPKPFTLNTEQTVSSAKTCKFTIGSQKWEEEVFHQAGRCKILRRAPTQVLKIFKIRLQPQARVRHIQGLLPITSSEVMGNLCPLQRIWSTLEVRQRAMPLGLLGALCVRRR